MKKLLLTAIIYLFLGVSLKAQSIATGQVAGSVCKGSVIALPFISSTDFDVNNVFKVQIRSQYSDNKWTDLETKGVKSPLSVSIPQDFDATNNISPTAYYIRVISTKPAIIGQESLIFGIYTKPEVTIVDASIQSVNPFQSTTLRFNGKGSLPLKVVFVDSTSVEFNELNSYGGPKVYPSKTTNYKVAYSENICGKGTGKGETVVSVNEIGIKILRPNSTNVCIDGMLKIPVSTYLGKKFNSDNVMKIGLRDVNYPDKEFEIDAIEKNNIVEAKIPNSIPPNKNYDVRIISSSPKATSNWTSYYESVSIGDKTSAEIISPSITVDWGINVNLKFKVSGVSPWHITLNDGNSLTLNNANKDDVFTVRPEETRKYSVTSVTSGCGVGVSPNSVMDVTVNSGVVLDSIQQKEACVGDVLTLKYSIKGNLNSDYFSVVLKSGYYGSPIFVNGTFSNGLLKVNIPAGMFKNSTDQQIDYYVAVSYKDIRTYVHSKNTVRIKQNPTATFTNTTPINMNERGERYLPITISASGIYKITFDDSTSFTNKSLNEVINNSPWNIPVNVVKTKTFTLKSISNSCATTQIKDGKSITVNVKNSLQNDIVISDFKTRVCEGDTIKIYFKTIGSYQPENEFRVELTNYSTPIVLGKSKTSPITIVLPKNLLNPSPSLKVLSSNPTSSSEVSYIQINTKPSAELSTSTKEVIKGEVFGYSIYVRAGIYNNTYTFSDGSVKLDGNLSNNFIILNQDTPFYLKSISNECGVGTVPAYSARINVVPFKITREKPYIQGFDNSYCVGSSFDYAYAIAGKLDPKTTFNLQIASIKDSVFSNLVSNTIDNPITAKIPSNLLEGNYFIRLINNTTPTQSSIFETITVASPISATMTATDGTNAALVEAGSSYFLKYNLKGTSPGNLTVSNENNDFYFFERFYFTNSYTHSINPTKSETFSIKNLENVCGFGTVNGSVKFTIKPSITIKDLPIFSVCSGANLDIDATNFGDFETDNIFKISLIDAKKSRFDISETRSLPGKSKIKLPNNIPIGYYQLEVNSSKPAFTKTSNSLVFVNTVPEITLSGNTTINSGQGTYINLVNQTLKNIPDYNYISNDSNTPTLILSDGKGLKLTTYKLAVNVNPSLTTTYTVRSTENICGIGKVSGNAIITVNPKSDKSIITQFVPNTKSYICSGTSYLLDFETKGVFSSTNKFTAQISDKNGENFKDIVSEGDKSTLKVTIPDNLEIGENYRIRVISTDKDATSGANIFPLSTFKSVEATLDSTTYFFTEGKVINIKINLAGGTPPWAIKFGTDELASRTYAGITTSPYIFRVNPLKPVVYKIFEVYDAYCIGKVSGTGIVKIELITANQELSGFEVKLFPNPTSDKITIQSDNFKNTSLQITDNVGRQLLQQNINKSETILDLSNYSSGQYYLQLERDNKKVVYKIMKL
jgi:hypothetical protein